MLTGLVGLLFEHILDAEVVYEELISDFDLFILAVSEIEVDIGSQYQVWEGGAK